MSSVEAVGGIINYLNQREFEHNQADAYHDRPLYIVEQRIHADYASFRLGSQFQPIVQLDDEREEGFIPRAYEALLVAHTVNGLTPFGHALSPQTVFALPSGNKEITTLDRLARTLHALNFLVQESNADLHLNVDPHHLVAVSADHGRVFEQILRQCGLDPAAIVLEIPEYKIRDKNVLRTAIAGWQSRGYRIAIDNFGCEHHQQQSAQLPRLQLRRLQLQRVLDLNPDFIKVDRSLLYAAERNSKDSEMLAKVVEKTSATAVQLIATGIETVAQQRLAQQLGFSFLQGFLYGRPAQDCQTLLDTSGEQRKYA